MKTHEQTPSDRPKQEILDELETKHFNKICALHTAIAGVESILNNDNFDTRKPNLERLRLVGIGLGAILDDYETACTDYIETLKSFTNQHLKG